MPNVLPSAYNSDNTPCSMDIGRREPGEGARYAKLRTFKVVMRAIAFMYSGPRRSLLEITSFLGMLVS